MSKKKSSKWWYLRIADAILEMDTIDLRTDGNGYPTVHWLIAEHMLQHLDTYHKQKAIPMYYEKVSKNFHHAVTHLREKCKIPIYRYPLTKKRNLTVVTTHEEYDKALESNYLRNKENVLRAINAGINDLSAVSPDKLPLLSTESQKAITENIQQK